MINRKIAHEFSRWHFPNSPGCILTVIERELVSKIINCQTGFYSSELNKSIEADSIFCKYILNVSHFQLLCLHFCGTREMHSFSVFKSVHVCINLPFFFLVLILDVVLLYSVIKNIFKSIAIYFFDH